MSKDNNKGTPAGFIFQFEIALLELSKLSITDSISLEKVDDVAKEDKNGIYNCTIQAKHSIKTSTTNFGNTSTDLWKTLNIWIRKLVDKIVNPDNKFIAITNKSIPKDSILKEKNFNDFFNKIIKILNQQKIDYNAKTKAEQNRGVSIKATIDRIEFAIKYKPELEVIFNNFEIKENLDVKEEFLNNIFVSTKDPSVKDRIYDEFLGWIQVISKNNWKNKKEAIFSKKDFDLKYDLIRENPTIINSLFRHKKEIFADNIDFNNRDEIYIKQIDGFDRFEKEEIIKNAILDFVYCDIEITRLIINKDCSSLTRIDYEEFEENCEESWKRIKRKHILKPDLNQYTDDELNEIGCKIYDEIISDLRLKFLDNWEFNDSIKYIQNGTFLKLSNTLKIGWHPKWEEKYKK
ncbi:hypothetical protein SAMN06265171_105175 [Chryseobacterium rhizoplanae]|uniref:ABC-three component systems C-terminal domain-containing protein n=1 Tax=Chryseobacterium rhizoplanae TaxID=1609531 RepID=A0A521DLG8_9FLAO|nr:ABC-three component system protein [Chryseobacterium rhizoplanae]SMO71780.1 hypothetical protein SAMN06265171_105175 [Chryseobacterium rhizoplanae]